MRMTEARNYLMRLAEGKDGIVEALQMLPMTNIVDGLLKCCANRRAVFTDATSTGCAPEITFYGAMLEETRKYKGLTDDEMVKIAIAGNKPAIPVAPVVPVPAVLVPVPTMPAKPVIAGEVDDVSDMDDDEELDKDNQSKVEPI
jgi:hypothetical protein